MSSARNAVARLVPLAEAVLATSEALEVHPALALAEALSQDLRLLFELDRALAGRGLLVHLLDLPQRLSLAGRAETALAVAQAFRFIAPDDLGGDIAVIHARVGHRELALAELEANLAGAKDRFVAEA